MPVGDIGYGTTIGYSDSQNGTYVDIANVTEIDPPTITVNKVDKTTYSSASYYREKAPGLLEAGEESFKILFLKTQLNTLKDMMDSRATKWWRIVFPLDTGESSASNFKSQGFVTELKNMQPLDDKMTADFKVQWTGKPVWTSGS